MTKNPIFKKRLKMAREEREEARATLKIRNEALRDLYGEILQAEGKDPKGLIVPEMWECEESPIGFCAYDFYRDPTHESCVFCSAPEERN